MIQLIKLAQEFDLSNLTPPKIPIDADEGEVVIGELTDELKALYGLWKSAADEYVNFGDEMRARIDEHLGSHEDPNHTQEDCDEFHHQLMKDMRFHEQKVATYSNAFWAAVEIEFGEFVKSLGIREGYKVVKIPDEKMDELHDLAGIHVVQISSGGPPTMSDIMAGFLS